MVSELTGTWQDPGVKTRVLESTGISRRVIVDGFAVCTAL